MTDPEGGASAAKARRRTGGARRDRRIRVAFVYSGLNPATSGHHYDNAIYNFFFRAMRRSPELEMRYYANTAGGLDASELEADNDVVLIWPDHNFVTTNRLKGARDLSIPVISDVIDPHRETVPDEKAIYHEMYGIDHYIGLCPSGYFYQYYPRTFKYREIVYGLEPSLYRDVGPFQTRIRDRILNSGVMHPRGLVRWVYWKTVRRREPAFEFYKLRTDCCRLPYVDYFGMAGNPYVGDRYVELTSKYRAAIAACTVFPTKKYSEIPASGCLTFMEITRKNRGEFLGFEDGRNAVFINGDNYRERFEEYLSDPDNPRWAEIASEGRRHALGELSNDRAVSDLTELMRELL